MTIRVTEPAPVFFPKEINNIGIINRVAPLDLDNKILEGIYQLLSLESKELNKTGAERAYKGLYDALLGLERFENIKLIEEHDFKVPSKGVFPASVPFEKIDELCRENNVDAIFELSFYDTDASFTFDVVPVNINNPLGVDIKVVEHELKIITNIKTGWRIYDMTSRVLCDEVIMAEKQVSAARGITPLNAFKAISGRKENVYQISSIMGENYAYRIMPYYTRVSRIYYVRGTKNFKIAKRMAQARDWHGAAKLWELELNNKKRKIAARACHNMAIINEIDGDLQSARAWASKAYVDYRNKKSLRYLRIIERRIEKNQLLLLNE